MENKQSLKDIFDLPMDVYPIGRLDYDSEGLLLVSNDKLLNHRLLNPAFAHEREYWVQVEGLITPAAMRLLSTGVHITVDGNNYLTKPAKAFHFGNDPEVADRYPPVRFRKNIPTSWLRLTLTEGKNRQVRKMTAAVGFPTLRLIRYRIGSVTIDKLQPGEMMDLQKNFLYRQLGIEAPEN